MASYKLIQDVEAEDHILGPLTLRQFIFAMITVLFLYISFIFVTKSADVLLAFSLPPAIFFGFFAIPFGRDQPTEIWFLAKLRFWFKPRKRIWNQSGANDLVKITVPKKIERTLTNGLSTYEVESRLKTLANTLDSRGWAIKNVPPIAANTYGASQGTDTDRLVSFSVDPLSSDSDAANEDILEASSPVAHHFDQMIDQSNTEHREQLIQQMNSPTTDTNLPHSAPDQWFMPQSFSTPQPITATDVPSSSPSTEDVELINKLKAVQQSTDQYSKHMHVLNRPNDTQSHSVPNNSNSTSSAADPVIMSLAKRDDLTIQTIDHVAKNEHDMQDEVIISLH